MPAKTSLSLREQLLATRADKIPHGWLTDAEVAKREGYPHAQGRIHYIIKEAVAAGLLEARIFRKASSSGVRPKMHYRYVK